MAWGVERADAGVERSPERAAGGVAPSSGVDGTGREGVVLERSSRVDDAGRAERAGAAVERSSGLDAAGRSERAENVEAAAATARRSAGVVAGRASLPGAGAAATP